MADDQEPRQLGAMLARLQSTTDDARREQLAMRAVFDAVTATSHSQLNETGVRLSNVELAQMRLSERLDHIGLRLDQLGAKLDRILAMLGG